MNKERDRRIGQTRLALIFKSIGKKEKKNRESQHIWFLTLLQLLSKQTASTISPIFLV